MNKIGIYYAYWTHEWDVDFHPYIDKAADLGFAILEVNGGTVARLSTDARRRLKDHADARGIDLTYCIGLPREYDIAADEPAVRKNGIAFLQQMARAIGEMGGGMLSGIIYGAWPATLPTGAVDKRPYVERSITSMCEAVAAAEDVGVIFNVEVVNRFEQYIMNTCAEALAYVAAVDSPNIKILLDTFHMNIEEEGVVDALIQAGDRLGHLHVGENNRMPPGRGRLPWTEIAAALRKIHYAHDVVMEPFLMPGGQVGRDIKVFRDLSVGRDLDQEARRALLFMRDLLQ